MSALFERLTGLTLESPWMLTLALLIPLALWLRRRRGAASLRFTPAVFTERESPGGAAAPIPASFRARIVSLPVGLHAVALLAVVVALARPVERTPLPLRTEGIEIVLCLDASSSMTARDMDARRTRLDVARDAALAFIAGRGADRIGLVTFARFPDMRSPLTRDHAALAQSLAGVQTVKADGPEDATGIGAAVVRSAQVVQAGQAKSKVVVLLTDGEENVATQDAPREIGPPHAAQLCSEMGVRVYCIAAGGATTDTRAVEGLAVRTGGRFFEARDANAVATVYREIDALERAQLDEPRFVSKGRFLGLVITAVVLMFAAQALRATWLQVSP